MMRLPQLAAMSLISLAVGASCSLPRGAAPTATATRLTSNRVPLPSARPLNDVYPPSHAQLPTPADPGEHATRATSSEPSIAPTPADTSAELALVQFEEFLIDDVTPPPAEGAADKPPPELLPAPTGTPDAMRSLTLHDVILSVSQSYPLLRAAMLEYDVAEGKQLAAEGAFDLALKTANASTPMGFYQTYRNSVKLEQPTFYGGAVFGEYRIGRGDFEPWYGNRQTNDGGEFKLGFQASLLKNRQIDDRRADILQAGLDWQAVDPLVRSQVLDFVRLASQTYWSWTAAGQAVEAQERLLRLATERAGQIEERVKAGDLEEIARIDNERLIASREAKLIEAQRKLQTAAIKLSLFWRDAGGEPIVPSAGQAPDDFPTHETPNVDQLEVLIDEALRIRPDINEIDLLRRKVEIELAEAENKLLPKLDARIEASKDVVVAEQLQGRQNAVQAGSRPVRRSAAAAPRSAWQDSRRPRQAAQINAKRQFVVDKITTQVQDAVNGMDTAAQRIARAKTNLRLAERSLELGREAFNAGDTDVIVLNIREQAVADARLSLIEAQADYFTAQADFQAALGADPMPVDFQR